MSYSRRILLTVATAALVASASGRPCAQEGAGSSAPNLLSFASGTIVRSYTKSITVVEHVADGDVNPDSDGPALVDGATGPLEIVYELPGVATLSAVTVTLEPAADTGIAVSTTSATTGFQDVGHAKSSGAIAGTSGVKARWIRVSTTAVDGKLPIKKIVAAGTLAPRPANAAAPSGDFWALDETLNDAGTVRRKADGEQPEHVEVVQVQNAINGTRCSEASFDTAYPGAFDGRTWTFHRQSWSSEEQFHGRFVVNDEGTLIVGADIGSGGERLMHAFERAVPATPKLPDYCAGRKLGKGTSGVLVLNSPVWSAYYPFNDEDSATTFKTSTFSLIPSSIFTPALLAGKDTVVLNALCSVDNLLTPQQTSALVAWVQAGHKLIIEDADQCGGDANHIVHYDFLPYKFVTNNPGASGAAGHNLLVVENSTLGSADQGDAEHYIDAAAYVATVDQQLGDANTVVSQDSHWCGHLFGTNANDVDGFMQMYAPLGKGLVIYEGLDADDMNVPVYLKVRALEFAQPIPGDLSCSRPVSAGFVIAMDQRLTFAPGTARSLTAKLTVIANHQWKGHVALAASGDFPASISAPAVDLPPAERPITVTVQIPATAKAGHYAVTVTGTGGGNTSRATLTISSEETRDILRAQLAQSCSVALYGINFDFNKTTIRKDAEPALQQVLALFTADPSLTVEIGGHTDNVGTAAYNATLSGGRADAVKAWLVAHGVDTARLTTHGYGDSVPLVPNTSDENRAKNRRVELKKPDCKQ